MIDRRGAAALLTAQVAVVALVAACSGVRRLPTPPPITIETTTSTTVIAYSTVSLARVAGTVTVPTIAVTPGTATLAGTVVDPNGVPVPGATVELQRVVDDQDAEVEVATTAAGTWTAAGILGGLYRVRAWRQPDLAQATADVVFVGATDSQTLNLSLTDFTGLSVTSSFAPNPPIINAPADLIVQVTSSSVDANGIVTAVGQPNIQVGLAATEGWAVQGSGTQVTDGNGDTSWQLTCDLLGTTPLSVILDGTQTVALDTPECAPFPATTTTIARRSSTTTLG